MRLFIAALLALTTVAACAADTYDPSWDSNALAGGKADGLADDAPALTLDETPRSGDVGGDRMEIYKLSLQRTDRIEVVMEVTSGDLDPHMTLYRGLSTYVSSESWERDGNALRKVYEAEEQGTYFLAMRAYEQRGEGEYSVRAKCLDGPCAGNFPEPWTELEVDDVEQCITQARRCAFAALPAYDGRVGDARSTSIFETCLASVSLDDGSSCASACDWQPEETSFSYDLDAARNHCDYIVSILPFYADQDASCISELDSCFSDCAYYAQYSYGVDGFGDTAESMCLGGGFNGSCDTYARLTPACNGPAPEDGYALCEYRCRSVDGAFVDDIQDICGGDAGCYLEEMCPADVNAAADHCGGRTESDHECIRERLDEMHSDCEWNFEDYL
jgi:hypothetical protein